MAASPLVACAIADRSMTGNEKEAAQFQDQPEHSAFGALVRDEDLRRTLRKTPEERLEMLCASLRDAQSRGMIPKRDRSAHEKKLLWLIQPSSSAR
jgi:hypothetical protein